MYQLLVIASVVVLYFFLLWLVYNRGKLDGIQLTLSLWREERKEFDVFLAHLRKLKETKEETANKKST